MPIIVDHTNFDAGLLSSLAGGYASRVLERQRAQEGIADRAAMDANATDQNIRQQRAMGDYALSTAPQRIANQVSEATAMLPVQAAGYGQRLSMQQQAAKEQADTLKRQRMTEWAPMAAQLQKDAPAHVAPWMLDAAASEYLNNGHVSPRTLDMLRPRTPEEVNDDAYKASVREFALAEKARRASAGTRAAEAFGQVTTQGGPPTPQNAALGAGLELGQYDMNDPAIRGAMGVLTPGEQTAAARADGIGIGEDRLKDKETRLQIDHDAGVKSAAMDLASAMRTREKLFGGVIPPTPAAVADATKRIEEAKAAYMLATFEAEKRLGLPGIVPNPNASAVQPTAGFENDPAYQKGLEYLRSLTK